MRIFRFHFNEIFPEGFELDPYTPGEVPCRFDGDLVCKTGPINETFTFAFESEELAQKLENRELKLKPIWELRLVEDRHLISITAFDLVDYSPIV